VAPAPPADAGEGKSPPLSSTEWDKAPQDNIQMYMRLKQSFAGLIGPATQLLPSEFGNQSFSVIIAPHLPPSPCQ